MTDKKRLEEIRTNQIAFKHWYDVNPKIQPQPYTESIGPTIEFLLAQIYRRDEALRDIRHKADGGCSYCGDWRDEYEHIVFLVDKALGDE
jgi:hypothetical protein